MAIMAINGRNHLDIFAIDSLDIRMFERSIKGTMIINAKNSTPKMINKFTFTPINLNPLRILTRVS